MGIITKRIGVTLTHTELQKLDELRLAFGANMSRAEAVRRLIITRHDIATGKSNALIAREMAVKIK